MYQALREFCLPLATLPLLVWLTYWGILKGQGVSDDISPPGGILLYDGKWQIPLSWHNVFKKFRWHAAIKPNPNKRWKENKQPAFLPNPVAHHRLNLWVFCGIGILLYLFLKQLLPESIAFLAICLWIVHPLGVQTVGWISGIGYVFSVFFMLIGLNLVLLAPQLGWTTTILGTLGTFLLFAFCQWMAVEAQFATVGATLILALLGQWPYAILSGMISIYGCANTLKEAVGLRKKVFHEQQMGQATKFYPRKLIIVIKTLFYDVKLACFPKRLGLYHTWGYHYELPYIEQEDHEWVGGILVFLLLGYGILFGSLPIQLGCVWFLAFMVLFLNWITANQFVVDRYVWLPSFGICLLAAIWFPPVAYWILFGIALMRTWHDQPKYLNEETYYLSNIANFPQSEVAWGNLGVTLMNRGLMGSAMDAWWRGLQLNSEYDVCSYNLSSCLKARGPLNPNYAPLLYNQLPKEIIDKALIHDPMRGHLHLARYFLQRAVTAKTCHFPKPWEQELAQINQELSRPVGVPMPIARLVTPLLTAALT